MFHVVACNSKEVGAQLSYNIACAPCEDSDQSAHPRSDQSSCDTLWIAKEPKRLQPDSQDSDQLAVFFFVFFLQTTLKL